VVSGAIQHSAFQKTMRVVLISTYELGRQPFGLASPAAWLRAAGADVVCLDLAVEPIRPDVFAGAVLVALSVPMHTATRLAVELIEQVRVLAPEALFCAYGLYAPLNEAWLRDIGVSVVLGGEFEQQLVALYRRVIDTPESRAAPQVEQRISVERLDFLVPDRGGLPPLDRYAMLVMPDRTSRVVGYTEATRGCKHTCRHCPIVPVYNGRFRVVARAVVLEDVRRQVRAGAQHITFGDPDFLNGPGHAIPLVQALHAEHPHVTYDVTIKVEHLLRYANLLPTLRDTGCLFVISAVESSSDEVLSMLDKRHTRAEFVAVARLMRSVGLALSPTFVSFTPWTTRADYADLLELIAELGLVSHVAPVQYAIRLLIPAGSKLLDLASVRELVGPFDAPALCYPWQHPDPAMDQLYRQILGVAQRRDLSRPAIYAQVRALAGLAPLVPHTFDLADRPIPHLSEPWYC
jgi:radical SAM superfamily enzyme YgiQ (UPF0313 family)